MKLYAFSIVIAWAVIECLHAFGINTLGQLDPSTLALSALTGTALLATIAALTDTGVRADERREMQKAVAEAQAAEERTKRAEARVAGLKDTIELVEAANEDLAARVVELETPRCGSCDYGSLQGVYGVNRFRKRPVEITAIRWDGGAPSAELRMLPGVRYHTHPTGEEFLSIPTQEGIMSASPGDWIIQGVAGEIYPCKPAIFAATYDYVAEE